MEKIDIILWVMGSGFAIMFCLMLILWNSQCEFRKEMKEDIKDVREDIKDIREDIKDIDRRLCRIEGAMASKDCCMLKDERHSKKAE